MSEPIYINGIFVREREGRYGQFFEVGIDIEQLVADAKKHGNGKRLNVTISRRQKPYKGLTHNVRLDTYSKEHGARELAAAHREAESAGQQGQFDDVPPPPEPKDDVPF